MKFGGSSLADAEKISKAAAKAIRCQRQGNQVVMVVSAMGKTTDALIDLAQQITKRPPRREMDQLLSTGEQVTIAVMAMALQAKGVDAISMTGAQVRLITDEVHTRARVKSIDAKRIHSPGNQHSFRGHEVAGMGNTVA